MANPNLVSNTSSTLDIVVQSQLTSGNNDFTVPGGTAWALRSFTITNVSGSSATLTGSVIKSGGSAREFLHSQAIAAGDTFVVGVDVVAVLPEAAVLRLNASAGTTLDVLVTGLVSA